MRSACEGWLVVMVVGADRWPTGPRSMLWAPILSGRPLGANGKWSLRAGSLGSNGAAGLLLVPTRSRAPAPNTTGQSSVDRPGLVPTRIRARDTSENR